jgi:hypothetical protein
MNSAEQRALMLLRALRFFYAALGAFATAAFVSFLGAALFQTHQSGAARALELIAVFTGLLAVGCLASGCVVLLRETRIAVNIVSEEATLLRQQLATRNRP